MDHILDRTLGTIGNIRDSNYLKSTLNYLVYGTLRNSRELNEIGQWGFLFYIAFANTILPIWSDEDIQKNG